MKPLPHERITLEYGSYTIHLDEYEDLVSPHLEIHKWSHKVCRELISDIFDLVAGIDKPVLAIHTDENEKLIGLLGFQPTTVPAVLADGSHHMLWEIK